MKIITFQPLKVLEKLQQDGVYEPEYNERLGQRVFCLKLDENTMENVFMTAPSMPQVFIEFEVDSTDVEVLDYLEWVNYLNGHNKYTGKFSSKVKYKEYAVKSIKMLDVLSTGIISKSDDPDKVQDDFMDYHFTHLENLSGHNWYRNNDKHMEKFWQSFEALNFVNKITHCMMPITKLTDSELEEAHQLIRKIYMVS